MLILVLFGCNRPSEKGGVNDLAEADTLTTALSVLAEDDGRQLVVTHCTGCHSAQLIVQNKASREGWESMILWMQETQNLADLGQNKETILNYLARNYAPGETGRRKPLTDVDWYNLDH